MYAALTIPDAALPYILFQRAYLRMPVTRVYRQLDKLLPFPTPLYNWAVALEARFGQTQIKARYDDELRSDYAVLQQALPAGCTAVLDIGCGMAGIDVFLQRHYAPQALAFALLDRTEVAPAIYYLFKPAGAFYNSLEVARELLIANGIASDAIQLLEAAADFRIPTASTFDLVLSLLSWGYHYPVETYLASVQARLRPGGVVILDVRKRTDGIDRLRQAFRRVEVLQENVKHYRIVATS